MDALRSHSLPGRTSFVSGSRPGESGLPEQNARDISAGADDGGQSSQRESFQETSHAEADLDIDEEQAEGERQESSLLAKHKPWDCERTSRRLDAVLQVLAPRSRRNDLEYEFFALDGAAPFASSCCHGAVYFSRGLLESLDDSSVTYFAAHEMAHTELRHFATRRSRLENLRRAIPAAPGSAARQRLEMAAVMAVRHMEEFEADHLGAIWLDHAQGEKALADLYRACGRLAPKSLERPSHPGFAKRIARMAQRLSPPDALSYLWTLVEG